jgi:hypothetical protein
MQPVSQKDKASKRKELILMGSSNLSRRDLATILSFCDEKAPSPQSRSQT